MRRTSIYSIPPGVQRRGAISQGDTTSGIAHPDPARRSVTHVYLKQESFGERCRSTRCRRCTVRFAFTCCSVRSNNPAVLTSHSPWLAPIGHRQPTRADVRQNEVLSAWERQQQDLDVELDRKLIICRGC